MPASQSKYSAIRRSVTSGRRLLRLAGLMGSCSLRGVGENAAQVRAAICQGCRWLGLELDGAANLRHGPLISKAGSNVAPYVIATDENLMIARHSRALLEAH